MFVEGPARDRPVEGDAHNQDEPVEPVRLLDMALHEAKASGFEVRKHRFDAPAHSVIKHGIAATGHNRCARTFMSAICIAATVSFSINQ